MQTDVLIIGSGAAGLSEAVKLAQQRPDLQITVLAKYKLRNCNTAKAQGGIAAVMYPTGDTVASHVTDTLKTGGPLLNREVVEALATKSPERIAELRTWGARFDIEKSGKLALGLEGGHSAPRIVHHKDQTGRELLRTLLEKARTFKNINLREFQFALRLLKTEGVNPCIIGAQVADLSNGHTYAFYAQKTILATGGSGQVYANTTNPLAATGDGIALAAEVGAPISNMQFVQFHPTALYQPGKHSTFLISEAVRGFGAHLINNQGERFLFATDARGELATRDVVSSAIFKELKNSGEACVFLDLRHLDAQKFAHEFPYINKKLVKSGLNVATDLIPVCPAAHYQNGGINTDIYGCTTVANLYALGECANNGLQGENRLASNSLAEALVFAEYIANHISDNIAAPCTKLETTSPEGVLNLSAPRVIQKLRHMLKDVMTAYGTPINTIADTETALAVLQEIKSKAATIAPPCVALAELHNLVSVAGIILRQKLAWQQQPVALSGSKVSGYNS